MEKEFKIYWMHCYACEASIEKNLNKIPWIFVKKISHKNWKLIIEIKDSKKLEKIRETIENTWYRLEKDTNANKNNKGKNLIQIFLVSIVFLIIFFFIQQYDILQYFSVLFNKQKIWISLAILMWIAASISTCLTITWSIVLWFSRYIDNYKEPKQQIKTQILFQIWRIVWFFILWWLLGLIWKTIQISPQFSGILNIIISVLIIYMWLHILNIVPSLSKLWIHLPQARNKKISHKQNKIFTPILWALTFFLPCGFTQWMQIIAISSGNFRAWASMMMAFAIWTLPVLFFIWMSWEYIKNKKYWLINNIIWILIIMLWILSINNSKSLINFNNSKQNITSTNLEYQIIDIWHNWRNTEPKQIELKAKWNYEIVINPESNWIWCMSTLVIPKISNKINRVIKWEKIIYRISNAKEWTYPIICWSMGMFQGEIIIK